MTNIVNSHIQHTQVKGRVITFVVDDVNATISDFATAFDLKGKHIEAKVAHRIGEQIKKETGAQRIKVLFTTMAKTAVEVALPKFENVGGQLRVSGK